jgi:hypothetical protein
LGRARRHDSTCSIDSRDGTAEFDTWVNLAGTRVEHTSNRRGLGLGVFNWSSSPLGILGARQISRVEVGRADVFFASLRVGRSKVTCAPSNQRFERSRGCHLRRARRGVDDWDKTASFCAGAPARRSTSSLGAISVCTLAIELRRIVERSVTER